MLGINDGAVAMIVASRKAVRLLAPTDLPRPFSTRSLGVEPRIMGFGRCRQPRRRSTRRVDDRRYGVSQINEAFAAQVYGVPAVVLACR